MTKPDYALARRMWHQLEPIHAVFYYAPEVFGEAAGLGYEVATRWPSYFAWRLAPLGAVGPHAAASACYSFSPRMVGEHVPAIWAIASPQQVLAARMRAVDQMYRSIFGELVGSPGLAEAARLARDAALAADTAGRSLAAANADLPWPDEPHQVLWQAITLLREHRGDGHIAVLLTAGGIRARPSCRSPLSVPPRRKPSPAAAGRKMSGRPPGTSSASRGWIDSAGKATERGRDGRDEIEWRTDRLADVPWRALGPGRTQQLAELTGPLLGAAFESGLLPLMSTLGIAAVQPPVPRP